MNINRLVREGVIVKNMSLHLFYTPVEAIEVIIKSNLKKIYAETEKILLTGILGGIFIGVAGVGQLSILQSSNPTNEVFVKFLGATIFPVGLILCLLLGGTLFIGNSLLFVNYLKKDVGLKLMLRNLILTWIGNFLGGGLVAYLSYFSGIFKSGLMQKIIVNIATNKLSLSYSENIFSGFLCNILVIAGIWLSTSSKDSAGKFYGCLFPIMLFVISGYQHVVANMFFITMAKIVSPESVNFIRSFSTHFLPVTIGNFLSGGVFFPMVFYYLYVHKK